MKVQSTDLLTYALTILVTHGWEKSESTSFGHEALESICARFLIPLENAQVDCSLVREEWDDLMDYAKRYLNLVQQDYKVIWWKLFNASEADVKKWTNILSVVELLFCLPMSNGHLERVFSQLKLIKGDRRSSLGEDRLDHLIRIGVEGPPLSQWDSSGAVELWWQDKTRRLNTHVETSCKTVQELASILQDVQDSLYRHLARNKSYKKTQFLAVFQNTRRNLAIKMQQCKILCPNKLQEENLGRIQ